MRVLRSLVLLVALGAPFLTRGQFQTGQSAAFLLGQSDFTASAGSPVSSHYFGAQDAAVDTATGKAFVVDKYAHRILRYANVDLLAFAAAPEAVLGQTDLNSFTPGTSAAKFREPNAIAITPEGGLWVADQANNRVLHFPAAARLPSGAAADLVLGQSDFTHSDPATTRPGMNAPAGLCLGADGTLWVVDQSNHRVLRFTDAAEKAPGADADGLLGQPDFTSSASGSDASHFLLPVGVAVTASGTLFVADTINSRILRFAAAAGKPAGSAADGVLGQPTLSGGFSGLTAQRLGSPLNLALDEAGTLAVADRNNRRCLLWTGAEFQPDFAAATAVLGQADFTSSSTTVAPNRITDPVSVKFDAAGRLWVADSNARRVLRFDPAVLVAGTFQPLVLAQRARRSATFLVTNLGALPAGFRLTALARIRGKVGLRLRWSLDGASASAAIRAGSAATRALAQNETATLVCRAKRKAKKGGRVKLRLTLTAASASYPDRAAAARLGLKL